MNNKPRARLAAAFLALAAPAWAQTAPAAAAQAGKTCVQVDIAGKSATSLACLNQELQGLALAASGQGQTTAPITAGSPSNVTGTFNKTGLAEQYGKNFGVSASPYRPPPPVFTSSVH